MNITLNGLCPECHSKRRIEINEVYFYCANCGLELITPGPIFNSSQYNQNYLNDLKRLKNGKKQKE